MAQTISLCPRRQSPAVKTPGTLVAKRPCSARTFERASLCRPRASSSGRSGPVKPIASNTNCADMLLGTCHLGWHQPPVRVLPPGDLHARQRLHAPRRVAVELLDGGQVFARILTELCRCLFLRIVEPVDQRPLRPWIILGAVQGWTRQNFDLRQTPAALAH